MHPARYVSPTIAALTFKEFQSSWRPEELTLPQKPLTEPKTVFESCPVLMFFRFLGVA